MKQLTVGFSKSTAKFAIFSKAIMLTQKTLYSHVYLKYYDDDIQRTIYFQASHTLVNYMGEQTFLKQETIIQEFTFNISDDSFITVQQFAIDNAGKPYGTMEILGLALVDFVGNFGIKIQNPVKDSGTTWICYLLIAALLNECENVGLPKPINDMKMVDMYNLVSSLPKDLTNGKT